jgi:hypothetical protein
MDGNTPSDKRKKLLQQLDDTPNTEIYIISSCETIGEGVDTKNANMCVFVDPKTSNTKIIQNIGRVLRRNKDQPLSTVLIPCFIDMNKFASAEGDPVKQDEIIREQMRSPDGGDYGKILNISAALKQVDEDLYESILNYPNQTYKDKSLEEQGFTINDEEDASYTEEDVQEMKDARRPLEIHRDDTIERFPADSGGDEDSDEDGDDEDNSLLRLYYDEEENTYKPIVRSDENEVDDGRPIQPPKKLHRPKMNIHGDPEILMLWNATSELDFSKKFSTVVIECSVSLNEERWRERKLELIAYIATGKLPSTKDKDPVVKSLGQW